MFLSFIDRILFTKFLILFTIALHVFFNNFTWLRCCVADTFRWKFYLKLLSLLFVTTLWIMELIKARFLNFLMKFIQSSLGFLFFGILFTGDLLILYPIIAEFHQF